MNLGEVERLYSFVSKNEKIAPAFSYLCIKHYYSLCKVTQSRILVKLILYVFVALRGRFFNPVFSLVAMDSEASIDVDEDDLSTTVMLQGDTTKFQSHEFMQRFLKGSRMKRDDYLYRLTYVPEIDDSLRNVCMNVLCTCCEKCPVCKQVLASGDRKRIVTADKCIQTDEIKGKNSKIGLVPFEISKLVRTKPESQRNCEVKPFNKAAEYDRDAAQINHCLVANENTKHGSGIQDGNKKLCSDTEQNKEGKDCIFTNTEKQASGNEGEKVDVSHIKINEIPIKVDTKAKQQDAFEKEYEKTVYGLVALQILQQKTTEVEEKAPKLSEQLDSKLAKLETVENGKRSKSVHDALISVSNHDSKEKTEVVRHPKFLPEILAKFADAHPIFTPNNPTAKFQFANSENKFISTITKRLDILQAPNTVPRNSPAVINSRLRRMLRTPFSNNAGINFCASPFVDQPTIKVKMTRAAFLRAKAIKEKHYDLK